MDSITLLSETTSNYDALFRDSAQRHQELLNIINLQLQVNVSRLRASQLEVRNSPSSVP
jgi:hypothetical protein